MTNKEAKDFLVSEAIGQAALEGVPLSDIERRMLYFTESDPTTCPDPFSLNDKFESQVGHQSKYEAKLSRLFDHAHKQLRKENSAKLQMWSDAIQTLGKGDHYILIMCDAKGTIAAPPQTSAMGQRVITAGVAAMVLFGISISLGTNDRVPGWIAGTGMVVAVLLCLLTLFLLFLQGVQAVRRKKPRRIE